MNIIHIHSHDTGKLISPYGYNLPTPNLEKLSEEMITFENYFTVSPTCTPSRSASMTGVYPSKNGLVGLSHRGFELQRKDLHMANVLKNNGYQTVLCGIQHEIGKYDEIDKNLTKTLGYNVNLTSNKVCGDISWDLENLDHTIEFLNSYSSEKPFFISHGTFSTHRPYYVSEEKMKESYFNPLSSGNEEIKKDNQNFQYSVQVYDHIIGEITNALKKNNLYNNTIVVISTDHGIANPEHKCNLNDEGTNIMLMMHVPGYKILNGKKCYSLLSNIDLSPTIYDLLQIKHSHELDGKSFKSILTNECNEINDHLFFEINYHTSYEPSVSIRTKDYRLTLKKDTEYVDINWSNIDNSALKTIYYKNFNGYKKKMKIFTDYRHDNNLLEEDYSEIIKKLETQLVKWDKERDKLKLHVEKLRINNKSDFNPSMNQG